MSFSSLLIPVTPNRPRLKLKICLCLFPTLPDFLVFIDPSHQILLTFVKNVVIHQWRIYWRTNPISPNVIVLEISFTVIIKWKWGHPPWMMPYKFRHTLKREIMGRHVGRSGHVMWYIQSTRLEHQELPTNNKPRKGKQGLCQKSVFSNILNL